MTALAILACGCASPPERAGAEGGGRTLELGDFVASGDQPADPAAAGDGVPTVRIPDRVEEATSPVADSQATPGSSAGTTAADSTAADSAATAAESFVPVGEPIVIDSLVGQVNGRPIFAHEFFEPIADQLRAEAAGKTVRQFAETAFPIIYQRLFAVVMNELYLAEAEAMLSSEQRVGLRYLLESFEEQQLRMAQGSRTETDQRLLEEQGITLSELREIARNEVLIRNLIRMRIQPRVIVSWKDIEREYERRKAEFNPPGQVTLGRIALFTERDAERIAQAEAAFAEGQSFESVATAVGVPEGGVWRTLELPPGGVGDLPLAEPYLEQLTGLEVGGHAGRFDLGDRSIWVKIISIDQSPGRSIYDPEVQRMLRRQLEARRENEEMVKHQNRLRRESSLDDLDQMTERLLEIAVRRYAVQM